MKQKLLSILLLCTLLIGTAYAQSRTISGTVTSAEDGSTLPGVSVTVQGSSVGTQTNANGSYSLSVPSDARALVFSFLGFATQSVNIGNSLTINVSLVNDAQTLEDVVVQIPYGSVRKTAFTGSESTIGSKTFEQQRVTSFTKALEGLVPGLVATNGGGQPGTNASVQIRGIGSVNASSSPLYVLDGVPYSGSNVSLSTDDIESVTVLKDASATALYGSRAANGVIMIQTKKGRSQKPKITANIRSGFQNRFLPEYDRVNSTQYYELMWEATRNRLAAAGNANPGEAASTQLIPGLIYNTTNVANDQVVLPNGQFNPSAKLLYQDDWQDALFQTKLRQDYNVNVNGGSETGNYYVSLGYVHEPGLVKFSEYERFTGRVNADANVSTWLKTGLGMDGALGYTSQFLSEGTYTSNPWYYTRLMGPIYPVWQRDASGNFIADPVTGGHKLDWGIPSQMGTRPYAGNSNLLGSLALDDRSSMVGNFNANTYIEAKFLKDFTFRTTLGGTYYNSYATTFQNPEFGDAANVDGRSTKGNTRQLSFTFNQVLSYDKTINEDHHFNVLLGHENYRFQSDFVEATRTGFPFPGTSELAPAATAEGSTSYQHNHRIEGYFSRLMYDFQEKYLFSASYRRDGTSRFFKDSRWGDFYSVGLGWRLSQEDFMSDVDWVNELKLKASYGETGNESILLSSGNPNYYGWQSLYSLGNNNVNFPGAIIASLANQDLAWEKNGTLNIGADFALFNNRLQGTIEWYKKESSNLLFNVPLPLSTGIPSITRNTGTMYNKGIDLQLGYHAIRTTDVDWRIDLNLTQFKNKITKLPEENRENGIVSGSKKRVEGKGIYEFWLREYAGVDPQTGDALYYKGGEPDGSGARTTVNNITQGDYYFQGTAIPDFRGGLQSSLRYKEFDLSVLFTFQSGGKFYDSNYLSLMHPGTYGSHWHADILNRWQNPGDITDVPRLQNALSTQNGASTRYLYDASYINFKNVSLGYNIPNAVLSQIGVANARIFSSVDNIHLFNSRKGMDPQQTFSGTADFTYTPVRTFTFGLSIGL
jgi:TonB-linked SusC/RagA family outer membrane protein